MSALVQAILLVSTLLSLGLAVYGYRQRPRPGASAFAVFTLAAAVWTLGTLGGTAADGLASSLWWTRLEYVGITVVPVSFFVLAARYTGNDALVSRRVVAALAGLAIATMIAMWTTTTHWLFYTDVYPSSGTFAGFEATHGPLYYAWIVVGYGVFLAGVALVVQMVYGRRDIYRKQAAATILAVTAPFVANVAYQVQVTTADFTPVAVVVAGVALGWAMHRYEFLDVTPVARKTIVENIHDGVLVLDDRDRVVDANPAARRLLDVPADRELVGRAVGDALDAPFDDLPARLPAPDREGRVLAFVTASGKRFLEVDVRPFMDAGGHERGRLCYLHDVTERERRERELERQNEQLERFASLVSHDLRNPLNVAEGYVENARETGDVAVLEEVVVSHDRMRAIIDDVLELAKHGQTVRDVEPVDLAAVARDAWANVDTATATLEVDATATVLADESRLSQLLENLYRNAVEHGSTSNRTQSDDAVEHGSPCSQPSAGNAVEHASTSNRTQSGDAVEHSGSGVRVVVGDLDDGFYVADDGPGIPEADRERVLEDGFSTNPDGTGLGLSIVKSVADAHDWTVRVDESDVGGARFAFTGTTFARDAPGRRQELVAD